MILAIVPLLFAIAVVVVRTLGVENSVSRISASLLTVGVVAYVLFVRPPSRG